MRNNQTINVSEKERADAGKWNFYSHHLLVFFVFFLEGLSFPEGCCFYYMGRVVPLKASILFALTKEITRVLEGERKKENSTELLDPRSFPIRTLHEATTKKEKENVNMLRERRSQK